MERLVGGLDLLRSPPSPSRKDNLVLSPCSTIPEVDDPFANVVDSTDPYLNALAIAIEEQLDNAQAPPVLSPSSVTLPTRMAPLGADGFLTISQWEESPLMPRLKPQLPPVTGPRYSSCTLRILT